MKRFQRLYVKYLIKNPTLYYAFLGFFVAVFLGLSLTIRLDIVKSYPATARGSVITVETAENIGLHGNKVYYYTSRNEKINLATIVKSDYADGRLNLFISETDRLSGEVTVDLIIGRQTLLERIFVKAGRNG
jgi:hypothetical protein